MAKPFIKCVGGKRDLAGRIIELFPEDFDVYVEPFLGGGAVFFELQSRGLLEDKITILGDRDADLIAMYEAVRDDPHGTYKEAKDHVDITTTDRKPKQYYMTARDVWNLGDKAPGLGLYLRFACYNGLWRVNKSGEMNTPSRDKLHQLQIPPLARFLEAAAALQDVELLDWDFRRYDELELSLGSVAYLDPPYDAAYAQYTKEGFADEDQDDLVGRCAEWSRQGAHVILSNSSTPATAQRTTNLWPESVVYSVTANHRVSCDPETRGDVREVIACAGPTTQKGVVPLSSAG